MTTDIDKLRELDNDEIIMALKDFSSQIRIRIKLDYMPYISKSEIEVSRLVGGAATALEAANKRIAELEIVNSNMKIDIRRGRQIIADLEEYQE